MLVTIPEPPGVQLQDLVRRPFRRLEVGRKGPYEALTRAGRIAETAEDYQVRLQDLEQEEQILRDEKSRLGAELAEMEREYREFQAEVGGMLRDIESLNREAQRGTYEVTAISIHAYAYLSDRYALLPHGASMGDGYGPVLVSREPLTAEEVRTRTVAIPGERTTANSVCGPTVMSAGSSPTRRARKVSPGRLEPLETVDRSSTSKSVPAASSALCSFTLDSISESKRPRICAAKIAAFLAPALPMAT